MKSSAFIFILGVLLISCAKEKEYKEIYKESTFNKILSEDPNDPYVYVPSVENTPMNVTASRPFWLGEQKLVTFKFTEKTLEVLEIPTDKRFNRNENNFSPVFKLDIEHKDYRCLQDDFGECSNKEEEVTDRSWHSKPYFKADFAKLTVLETNTLPEQLTNLFQKCFSDRGSAVKSLKMDADSLNITVERTMTAGIECADLESFDDLRNLTFKVNYHYSFVKLSKIAAKDYQPVTYPNTDQNTFGFFTTKTKKLTADNRETLDSDLTLMNRWNPNRKEVTYYLNEAFYDEDMKSIKDSTEKAMATINKSFEQAGVDMKINLADGRGKQVGDLRNSFLVLVKDPQASGVIGYGPTVANPLTGEILKGQVIMYYGSIRKYIQETYDELVLEAQGKAELAESDSAALAQEVIKEGKFKNGVELNMLETQQAQAAMRSELLKAFTLNDVVSNQVAAPVRINNVRNITVNNKLIERLKTEIFSHDRIAKNYDLKDEVEEMSRHNLFHHSMVNWNEAVGAAINESDIDLKNAKPWNDLSDSEKDAMITKLMPNVWIPTLVHEFGHNLGLRHNFSGSEDKDNYYSKEERAHHGIGRDVTYSSVMDYSYSSLNQLPIMGKYDIAALRFAYNRQLELKTGEIVSMPKGTLEEMKKAGTIDTIKSFEYCTDEHTSVNAGCNRFDEGSNLKEIAEHYVRAYKKLYAKRNHRNNRLNFSSQTDGEYYSGVRGTFEGLRIFFESFDRIKGMYPNLAADQWESIEFLKELKAATQVAADFYIEVLKTPAVHCVLVDKTSGQLAGILPLNDITFNAISCFDTENLSINKEKYDVIATVGKHLNHARGPELRGDIKADPTQLSVRGIWADKLLAMDYLMKREMKISTFDDYRTSFIDHPEFKDQVMDAVLGFMSDKMKMKVDLEGADGEKIPYENTFTIGDTHNITKSFSYGLNAFLGIKKASTDIRELLFPMIKKNLQTADDETETFGLLRSLTAIRVDPTTFIDESQVAATATIKDAQGRNVAKFVALGDNILAKNILDNFSLNARLKKFKRDQLVEVYLARAQSKVPEVIPSELKEAYEMELPKLLAFLRGEIMEDSRINKILSIMSL